MRLLSTIRLLAARRQDELQTSGSVEQPRSGTGMRSGLVVATGAAAWLGVVAAMAAGALAQEPETNVERFTDGDAERGASLYKRYCAGCHGQDGRGGAHTFMPHVGSLTRKDYIEFVPDRDLFEVIDKGGTATGRNSYMPAWGSKLSDQDIKDVIAHIRSLPTY
jgi:mono/diheme cytochrome c family protein